MAADLSGKIIEREGATRFITGCILPVSDGAELGYRR